MNNFIKFISLFILIIFLAVALQLSPKSVYAQTVCTNPYVVVGTPFDELGVNGYWRLTSVNPLIYIPTGEIGGLYSNGLNIRPPEHDAAGINIAQNQIQPLDLNGNPDPLNGRIVLVSLGMSNTQTEFGKFVQDANADQQKNPKLLVINGAISGGTSDRWANPDDYVWTNMANNVRSRTNQVQVAWIKVTRAEPLSFPDGLRTYYQADLEQILRNFKIKYPNLKMVLFSSRMRDYSYLQGLSPEPTAYETAYAIRWVIEKQISGDLSLNYNSAKGEIVAPYVAWGPYVWIDGLTPNILGEIFPASYLLADCTHPTVNASQFISNKLLSFLKADSLATPWFLAPGITITPSPTPTPTDILTPTPTLSPTPTLTPTPTPIAGELDLNTNLAVFWNFATNSPNNVAGTCTGCVNQGATWTENGKYDGAFQFDGVNDYINLGSFPYLDNASSFTFSTWIKPDFNQTAAASRTIIGKPSQLNIYYFPNINDWRISFRSSTTNNAWIDTLNLNWLPGTWHHLVVTYNGMTVKLFWDGILANSKNYSGTVYPSTSPTYLGAYPGVGYYFLGTIDEVRVYRDRVLTDQEISQMFSL